MASAISNFRCGALSERVLIIFCCKVEIVGTALAVLSGTPAGIRVIVRLRTPRDSIADRSALSSTPWLENVSVYLKAMKCPQVHRATRSRKARRLQSNATLTRLIRESAVVESD